MRCDLHVHTNRSGMCTIPLLRHVCRESYNEPLAVYEKLAHEVTATEEGLRETLFGQRRYSWARSVVT